MREIPALEDQLPTFKAEIANLTSVIATGAAAKSAQWSAKPSIAWPTSEARPNEPKRVA
jgi:hypothetical protein